MPRRFRGWRLISGLLSSPDSASSASIVASFAKFIMVFRGNTIFPVVFSIMKAAQTSKIVIQSRLPERHMRRSLLISAGISGSSRWSKTKDTLAKDPRYKAVPRDSREKLFRAFVASRIVRAVLSTHRSTQAQRHQNAVVHSISCSKGCDEQGRKWGGIPGRDVMFHAMIELTPQP